MATPEELAQQFEESVAIIKSIATGDATTTVALPSGGTVRSLAKVDADSKAQLDQAIDLFGSNKLDKSAVNEADGVAGLQGFKLVIKNAVGALKALVSFNGTADRSFGLPDKDGTLALVSDITDRAGVAGGLATLDQNGLVPAVQLPSYVDDVIEAETKAALPAAGERGKIYVVIADETKEGTTSQYRWSGTAYVILIASAGSTDAVVEGANNKYFTGARVLSTVLTGFSTASALAVTAADTVGVAFGKLQAQMTAVLAVARTYDFHAFVPGKAPAASTVLMVKATRAFTIAAAAAGSQAEAKVAATAGTVFVMHKNGVEFGQVTFAAGQTVPSFTVAAATNFAVGDKFSVVAPATQDATLSDVALSFFANLT